MYYEYSEKVGETYKSSATEIGITGFCDSSNNFRLNLGSIAKPNRNPLIRYVRENIREGVRFYNRNGDVFIDCLSNSPIFIQAPLCSHVMGHHLATVYRVEPGHSMQIFSARKFDYLIFEAQKRGPDAIAALQQICCCRLSFLKGWGENYQIQTVLEVPVWIEVLFIGALHELDLLIMQAKNSRHQHLLLQAAQQDIDDLSSCPSMSIS
uniref:MH2 domain-containing protein n=1 Tax=Panagrolaimus superbus TaxID=310955 RepID=A0A914XWT6_9BILA